MGRPRILDYGLLGLLPALLAVLALSAGAPLRNTIPILAIAYVLMFGVYFSERISARSMVMRGTEAIARNARAIGIALTRRVQYRGRSRALQITSRSGVCPLGLEEGAVWEVDASGRLNRPICRPAALAMGLVLQDGDPMAQKACVCPRGPQSVSFAVQPGG